MWVTANVPWRVGKHSEFSGSTSNRCRTLVKNRKSSIFASGSPKHILRPVKIRVRDTCVFAYKFILYATLQCIPIHESSCLKISPFKKHLNILVSVNEQHSAAVNTILTCGKWNHLLFLFSATFAIFINKSRRVEFRRFRKNVRVGQHRVNHKEHHRIFREAVTLIPEVLFCCVWQI